jgi:hypothetical protein
VDNNQTTDNLSAYQPNLDAIEEFKMITNNASAEFGNFQGGIINVVIKSGTNQFHGNAFEYFRNDKLNANNWGRNWGVGTNFRPPIRWNQFGGTFGGPVKKDKLFFFADYQGLRRATPPSVSATKVMPVSWRQGDFSNLLNPTYSQVAGGIQLYNPYSENATTGARAPFPNNQIPVSLFNPVIKNLFANQALYPLPSLSQNIVTDNNYFYTSSSYINSDQGDIKLDYKASSKDDLSARYSNGRQDTPGVNTAPFLYNSFNIAPFQNGVINWTRTINPSLVNEARVGVNNIMLNNGGADKGLGDIGTTLGMQNAGTGLLSLQGFAYTTSLGNANVRIHHLSLRGQPDHHQGPSHDEDGRQHFAPADELLLCRQQWPYRVHELLRPVYRRQRHQPRRQAGGRSRFHPGHAQRLRPRPEQRHLGATQHHLGLLLPGRLARH